MPEKRNAEMLALADKLALLDLDDDGENKRAIIALLSPFFVAPPPAEADTEMMGAAYEKHAKRIFGTGPRSIDSVTHFYSGFKAALAAAPPPTETAEHWSARWQKAKEEMANLPAEPVAWRFRFDGMKAWNLLHRRPHYADDRDVICEPLYSAPQPQGDQT